MHKLAHETTLEIVTNNIHCAQACSTISSFWYNPCAYIHAKFNNLGGTVKQFRRLACVLIVSGSEALRKKDNSFKAQTALKLNRAR